MRLTAPALAGLDGVRHGFFGRQGGVSEGVWSSLNVGLRSGDEPARIAANRARIALDLGLAPERLVTARQVHGDTALVVDVPWPMAEAPEADALVTDRPGLLLGVLAADCGPVLFADAEAGVIGAAHAGWKGALGGILEATLAAMAGLGAVRERITAVLGPCIGQASYEVGPEFVARFTDASPANARFFVPDGDRARFDLKGFVADRLVRAGVGRVEVLPHDTCADEARFFSYRRTTLRREERFGLQLSAIALEG
jgi:YfiH family protein